MKVYTYSSFDGSKVGFQVGTFEPDAGCSKEYYIPQNNDINSKVRKAFESGIIRKIYGKLPHDENYVVMVKGIKSNADSDHKKYGNFAFEFDKNESGDYSKYQSYIKNAQPENLYDKADKFLIPDNSVGNYALKIDAKEFKNFMNEIDENKNYDMNDDEKEYLYVETNYKNSDHSDKLNTIFNTTDIARTKDSGVYTNNPKKKLTSNLKRFLPFILGLAAVIIIIVGIIKTIKRIL